MDAEAITRLEKTVLINYPIKIKYLQEDRHAQSLSSPIGK